MVDAMDRSAPCTYSTRAQPNQPNPQQGMRAILRLEGYQGLYKGLSPALLANGVSWGGYFLFYEHAKNRSVRVDLRVGVWV